MIYSNAIEEYLELFTLEEILEQSDLTDLETLTILYRAGHIKLPPYLEELGYVKEYEAMEE